VSSDNNIERQIELCGAGKPITNDRILKYDGLARYLIQKHFESAYLPNYLTFSDLLNRCRFEVVKALKKVDPVKALSSKIPDENRRILKLAEKAADPEAAMEQACQNLCYWAIDNYLRRMKYLHGFRTGLKKNRVRNYSLEKLHETDSEYRIGAVVAPPDITEISHNTLRDVERRAVESLYDSLMWVFKYRKTQVRSFFENVPEQYREKLGVYVELRAQQGEVERSNPLQVPLMKIEEECQ
jgi:hypothetical protein